MESQFFLDSFMNIKKIRMKSQFFLDSFMNIKKIRMKSQFLTSFITRGF